MRLRFRDEAGATAIEYGLIAGIIALGLVGSLVGTRTSLNAIFGQASGQMGSANGGGSSTSLPATSNPQSALWSRKTLAAAPTQSISGNVVQTNWVFTDGTTVSLRTGSGGGWDSALLVTDPAHHVTRDFETDQNGNQTLYATSYYDAAMKYYTETLSSNTYASPLTGSPPTMTTMVDKVYSGANNLVATYNVAPSAAFASDGQDAYYNFKYFTALASAMR